MNEWLKRIREQAKALWARWNLTQKIIFFSIIGAAILAVIMLFVFSATPGMVAVISTPVKDEDSRMKIVAKLEELGIRYDLRADNIFYVPDDKTAKRVRMVLNENDLIPKGTDPWALFDVEKWTTTDFERDVNLQRAITKQLEQHILAVDAVDNVSVTLVVPKTELFTEDQKEVSASIILTPKVGVDLGTSRRQVEGIQRLIKLAVAGLKDENIVIADQNGIVLNDFTSFADIDRLALAERELAAKRKEEAFYKSEILKSLKEMYGPERVSITKIDIDLDMSKVSSTAKEYSPIAVIPASRFAEAQYAPSITISEQSVDESFKGTGFNVEGPPGQEGQTSPAYKDLSNLVGDYSKKQSTKNNVVNEKNTTEEKRPWDIKKVSIGVGLDGVWHEQFDKDGRIILNPDGSIKREFVPVPDDEILKAKNLIQAAIGFSRDRGDLVSVEAMKFDRSAQFEQEDSVYRRQLSLRRTLISILIGIGAILVIAFVYRLIAKEAERRRRLREEELARQHQAMREAALRSAEEQGVEVELSVEDRARLEMQENAVNMAREHPEDVAQLIRTWLVEE
jgi:flagellar M-ring protein FliF